MQKNNIQDYVITPTQQKNLFKISYSEIAADTKRIATKPDVQAKYGKTNWDGLNTKIKDVVVDLRYRGDYTPETRKKIQKAIADNDLKEFTKLLSDKNYWVKERGVPEDRFQRRKNALLKQDK